MHTSEVLYKEDRMGIGVQYDVPGTYDGMWPYEFKFLSERRT